MYKGNFEFLKQSKSMYFSDFYHYLQEAEKYCCSNPQGSAIIILSFAEIVVKKLYHELKLDYEMGLTLKDRISNEPFSRLVNKEIISQFEFIYAVGINAKGFYQENEDSNELDFNCVYFRDEVLVSLEAAYNISYWLYNTIEEKQVPFKAFKKPCNSLVGGDCIDFFDNAYFNHMSIEETKIEKLSFRLDTEEFKIKNQKLVKYMFFDEDADDELIEVHEDSIKLIDFFEKMTNSQERAIKEIEEFLNDPFKKVHILRGYSGTGKTHLIKGLTNYFDKAEKNYFLIAPTGKATRVIQAKTKKSAQTIHKCIYELKYLKDEENSYKMYFHHDEAISRPSNSIFIVDEASMIGDNFSMQEYYRFGSGKLLSDLIEFTNIHDPKFNNKIILIGDSMQLPPVGMQTSPALSKDYLEKTFNLKVESSELTDVVRQEKESGILKNATMIRNYIQSSSAEFMKLDFNYDDMEQIEQSQVFKDYLSQPKESSIIVAYSNKTVDTYNDKIREKLFPLKKYITSGDVVMAIANNSKLPMEVNNGDFGRIVDVNEDYEIRNVQISKKINEEEITVNVPLVFRTVEIDFSDTSEKSSPFKALIFENILYRSLIYANTEFEQIISSYGLSDSDIDRMEKQALYIDVVNRARKMGIKPNSKEFQKFIFEDIYFNSLKIKFGYAITCHKSQGSEWKNVYLDAKTFTNTASKDYLRWLYTAITRASKKVYMIQKTY